MTEEDLSKKVPLGKSDIKRTTENLFNPIIVKVVFKNKMYVGALLSKIYRHLQK